MANRPQPATAASQRPEQGYEILIKLVLIGDSGVGKSNLLSRFTLNEFSFDSKSTIGVEFSTKSFEIDGRIVKVQVWDTAGQERYKAITSSYYRGSSGALLVYDITQAQSFENIQRWLNEVREYSAENILLMLVGNKRDLKDQREVSQQQAMEFAKANKLFFLETSAFNEQNVSLAFETLIKHVYLMTSNGNMNGGAGFGSNNANNDQNGDNADGSGNNSNDIGVTGLNDGKYGNGSGNGNQKLDSQHKAVTINLNDKYAASSPKSEKRCCQ